LCETFQKITEFAYILVEVHNYASNVKESKTHNNAIPNIPKLTHHIGVILAEFLIRSGGGNRIRHHGISNLSIKFNRHKAFV